MMLKNWIICIAYLHIPGHLYDEGMCTNLIQISHISVVIENRYHINQLDQLEIKKK